MLGGGGEGGGVGSIRRVKKRKTGREGNWKGGGSNDEGEGRGVREILEGQRRGEGGGSGGGRE